MKWLLNKCRNTGEKGTADSHLTSAAIIHWSLPNWAAGGIEGTAHRKRAKYFRSLHFEC